MITLSSLERPSTLAGVTPARRSMRVAYFAGTMRPGHDGVTRVLYQLIPHLKRRQIENVFFSPIVAPGNHPTTIHQVPSVTFPLYKDYRIAVPGYKHFEDRVREFKPDILHINSPCSLGYAAVKYAHKADIPVVATYHTHFASYARYYSARAFEALSWSYFRKLYNGCQRVYVPSHPILHELRGHGLRNLEFLPHGVDVRAFHPRFKDENWKMKLGIAGKIAVLFVGRLVWEKDLQTLADTYKILAGQRSDVAFVLVGDGPIRSELQTLMPGARFLGYQAGHDLSTSFASSDIFVFPSTTETFGNVTIEAMASGLPPVCANEGGSSGLIEGDETGILARPRDPQDFAARINKLIDSRALRERIAQKAYTFARQQSWEGIFDRLIGSYDRVIDEFSLQRLCKAREAA